MIKNVTRDEVVKAGKESIEIIHKIGNRYRNICDSHDDDDYRLIQCKYYEMILVNLATCNRQRDPIVVKDISHITEEEFNRIAGFGFELVTN